MIKKKINNYSLLIPLISMVLSILILCLYELGIIARVHYKPDIGIKKTVFNSNDLVRVDVVPDDINNNLMLINSNFRVDSAFEGNITEYKDSGVFMDEEVVSAYGELSAYIHDYYDDSLYISSSYRTYEDQMRVYEEEGAEIAALPGTSEHQSGLALDVYVMYYGGSAFINSEVGNYVNNNCGQYGFIIRYPQGMESITGFEYEPWHIRYVGLPHSEIIMNSSITLEEYFEYFNIGTWYSYGDYLISRQPTDNVQIPSSYVDNGYLIEYSLDNTGNYFITINTKK